MHEEARLCACLHHGRRIPFHLERFYKWAPQVVSRISPCRSSYWSKSDWIKEEEEQEEKEEEEDEEDHSVANDAAQSTR